MAIGFIRHVVFRTQRAYFSIIMGRFGSSTFLGALLLEDGCLPSSVREETGNIPGWNCVQAGNVAPRRYYFFSVLKQVHRMGDRNNTFSQILSEVMRLNKIVKAGGYVPPEEKHANTCGPCGRLVRASWD